jgi:hypothetical protein
MSKNSILGPLMGFQAHTSPLASLGSHASIVDLPTALLKTIMLLPYSVRMVKLVTTRLPLLVLAAFPMKASTSSLN